MELMLTIILIAIFAAITYKMAESRGRNVWGYTGVGLLLSPIAMWIVLALLGKTDEQKHKEMLELKAAMQAAEPAETFTTTVEYAND